MTVLIAILSTLALAGLFAAGLRYASRKVRVEHEPMVDRIDRLLPQTQCGKCGHPACRPYAEAIAAGEDHNRCPPGGKGTIRALSDLLDREVLPLDETYGEEQETKTVAYIREDECIGCTKCIQACPVDAIVGAAQRMHTVIVDECTGCDLCVEPCPVDCIDMIPVAQTDNPDTTTLAEDIPLVRYFRDAKNAVREKATEREKADRARRRFEARQQRIENERREKQARREASRRRVAQPAAEPAAPAHGSSQAHAPGNNAKDRSRELKAAKTAYNMAKKQCKQAEAAFERARRDGATNLNRLQQTVDKLRDRMKQAREQMQALMEEAKSDVKTQTGEDLKTLKIEAARLELEARRKAEAIQAARNTDDGSTVRERENEYRQSRQRADDAANRLKQVMEDQGMKEDE